MSRNPDLIESNESTSEPGDIAEAAAANSDSLRRSLVASINDVEQAFRRDHPLWWGVTLLGPFLVTIGILASMVVIGGVALASKYVTTALLTFFVLGRFVILCGSDEVTSGWAEQISLAPYQLFFLVTYMDFAVAFFVTFHMGILFRMPWIGEKIAALVSDGKFIMDHHPWIKRIALFGLILFVVFPTSTTGSIGGSIFGRLLGLGRFFTVAGVLIGSVIGNGLMFLFAKEINKYIGPESLWLKFLGVFILILGCVFVEWRYRQTKKRYLAKQDHGSS